MALAATGALALLLAACGGASAAPVPQHTRASAPRQTLPRHTAPATTPPTTVPTPPPATTPPTTGPTPPPTTPPPTTPPYVPPTSTPAYVPPTPTTTPAPPATQPATSSDPSSWGTPVADGFSGCHNPTSSVWVTYANGQTLTVTFSFSGAFGSLTDDGHGHPLPLSAEMNATAPNCFLTVPGSGAVTDPQSFS